MLDLYPPAILVALVITVVEMTEVVALVFALSADHASVRPGVYGAVAGTTVVAVVALALGAALTALPENVLLWASAVVLAAFGIFLFRSTLRAYRRQHAPGGPAPRPPVPAHLFAGGFTVGAVEAIEAVIVLLALAAAGHGEAALVGALSGGAALVVAAALVHDRIRRIKVPLLKLGATSMLFAFAVFWGGEAAGFAWPGRDLVLLPLFLIALVVIRGLIRFGESL
ncbi:MAG TPA: hypothetical protein VIZ68_01295, partial [Thermoplasmata archaeon]